MNVPANDIEWVVNDAGELGVKVGDTFAFLYKGRSIEYETGQHDDGTPMRWRPVYKREFGECCHPPLYPHPDRGLLDDDGRYTFGDPEHWRDLPVRP